MVLKVPFQIDNNLLENRFRPVALGRKNWLFAGNHQSAERSGIIYSILQSCALHKIEPHSYIRDVLTRLPSLLYAPDDKIDELLPGNWKPSAVKLYPTIVCAHAGRTIKKPLKSMI